MSLIRVSKKFFAAALLAAIFVTPSESKTAGFLDSSRSAAQVFLSDFPEAVRAKIIASMKQDSRQNVIAVVQAQNSVFSLVMRPAINDTDPDVEAELENISLSRALITARGNLALYIGQSKTDRNLYIYDEPLGFALFSYYERPREIGIKGIESFAEIIRSDGKNIIAALAWVSPDSARVLSNDIPEKGALTEDYCRTLYKECAQILFRNGFYSEALPMFRNIHRLRWANVEAYIDAAECFARTGEPDECVKLLKELLNTLQDKMSSDELTRAGRLFRRAGDRSSALSAFRLAQKRYRSGQ